MDFFNFDIDEIGIALGMGEGAAGHRGTNRFNRVATDDAFCTGNMLFVFLVTFADLL